MAKCPNCGRKLKWYNVRAECPDCGANIPNYNWEGRLEADADAAETAFARLHYRLDNFKSATVGSPLRIVRLVVTLLPLVGLVVPLLNATLTFPLYENTGSISFLTFVLDYLTKFDIGSVLKLVSGEILGGLFLSLVLAMVFALLAVAAGVLNFFVVLLGAINLNWLPNVLLNVVSFVVPAGARAVPAGFGDRHHRRRRPAQAEKDAADHRRGRAERASRAARTRNGAGGRDCLKPRPKPHSRICPGRALRAPGLF